MARSPLYERVAEDLRRRVLANEFGDTLPSQDKLCEIFDVSRSTIREATRSLELDGLVKARQGLPTIVQLQGFKFDPGLEELSSTSDLVSAAGSEIGTLTLTVEPLGNDRDGPYAEIASADLVKIKRVRTGDGVPLVYSEDIIAGSQSTARELETELQAGSLMDWLAKRDTRVVYARTSVSAKSATAREAGLLGTSKGAPLMVLDETGYGSDDKVIYKSRDLYRPDMVRFHVIRRPTK
jgi:GntR family transcriptional regulator